MPVLPNPAPIQLVPQSTRDTRARARALARAQARGEAEDKIRERQALAQLDRSTAAAWRAANRANDSATRAQEAALRLHWARSRSEAAQVAIRRR